LAVISSDEEGSICSDEEGLVWPIIPLRELSSELQDEYNEFHPHQSLNNLSPNKYLEINT
jgi:hypothetical protein